MGVDDESGFNSWKWTVLRPTELKLDPYYMKVKLLANIFIYKHFKLQVSNICSILISLIPFTSIIFLNFSIYKLIKQKALSLPQSSIRDKREQYVATILLLIVMIYISCHSIASAINVLELFVVLTGKI